MLLPATRKFIVTTVRLIRECVRELMANDFLRMAGATAFFASFALPPILIIIVRTLGIFMSRHTLGRRLTAQLTAMLGSESTGSVIQATRSFLALQHSHMATAGIFLFLLFVATTLFRVIKNSINEIWRVRTKPGSRLVAGLRSRALSVAVILMAGILFLVVQLIDTIRHLLAGYLMNGAASPRYADRLLTGVIVVVLSTVWFYVLFLWLPDGKPHRKVALFGAFITSILYNTGKWVMQAVLNPVQVHHFYGASGALVLLLLFVFYSAIMLYFGAAFTKVWGAYCGAPVRLKAHTIRYRLVADDR